MRVLVVGGTGLIGRATAESLRAAGAEVTMVSRKPAAALPPGVEWVAGDVTSQEAMLHITRQVMPDAILHLAALLQFDCERDPAKAVRVNIDGTLHVLEAARAVRVPRVVFGSSIAVYGQTGDLMTEERQSIGPVGFYGLTKLTAEALGDRYQAEYGVKFISLRYSGVFGIEQPGADAGSAGMSLVRKQILQCAAGSDVRIEGASGTERIHLTHVSDAAAATFHAIVHPNPSHTTYNVAGPRANYVSLQDLHEVVRRVAPGAGRAIWSGTGKTAGPVETRRLELDLRFTPRVSVADGVAMCVDGRQPS